MLVLPRSNQTRGSSIRSIIIPWCRKSSSMASREQAGPGDQPRRPARATGLPTRRVSRQQAWSRRSLSSWRRPRQLLAAAFVAIVGVGVLLRARAAIDDGSASPPSVIVAEPLPADKIPDVAAPSAIPAITPPSLAASPPVTPTNVVSSTQAPLATIPASAPTPDATTSIASPQVSVTSAVPQAAATPVPEPSAPANAKPESTAPTEEAAPQAESATPTPAPNQPGPAYRTYVVQPGDILKQIAARYGVSMASIIALNNISESGQPPRGPGAHNSASRRLMETRRA
jgi:LysM repeat protein